MTTFKIYLPKAQKEIKETYICPKLDCTGGNIVRLKTILGHSNIAVTNEYLAMFGQDLQMDFEKFNPLDNLKNKNREQIRM